MLVRIITLRFNAVIAGFDDTPLRDFIKDKEIVSIRDYFFIKDEIPYLTLLVIYVLNKLESPATITESVEKKDESWRTLLTEADIPLFDTLRDWRAERCKKEGIPPYVICTNRQLAQMIKVRPVSLSQLAEVEGFGKAKMEKYGKEILTLLSSKLQKKDQEIQAKTEKKESDKPETKEEVPWREDDKPTE